MIRLKSRRNDRENRRRRPFPGLVHTPGTPLLHHLGGDHGWRGFAPGPRLRERTRRLRIFFKGPLPEAGARSEHQHFAAK